MKMNRYPLFLLIFLCGTLNAQDAENMAKLSSWHNPDLPMHSLGIYNDIWGYVDENNREYAIIGSANFVHFVDVTDPNQPVLIDQVAGGSTSLWRDFKVYRDRAYAVADSGDEGLLIFDLSNLPNEVTLTNQTTAWFEQSHNIFIDTDHGRLYVAGSDTENDGLIVFDLTQDPDNPTLISSVNLAAGMLGEYVHDVFVRDNIAYCSHGNTSSLVIWDFNDAENPSIIASIETGAYNHSNWLTDDGQTLIVAEEVPLGMPLIMLDLANIGTGEIEFITSFKEPLLAPEHEGATPHNPFILGDFAYVSYYEDGLVIFDISDPANPKRVAYYDTYPDNTDYNGYAGCWGVYPYLPSGNIIASDMQTGLYVLELDEMVTSTQDAELPLTQFEVLPNPVEDILSVNINSSVALDGTFRLYSSTGQLVQERQEQILGATSLAFDMAKLPAGMYFLQLREGDRQWNQKVVKR